MILNIILNYILHVHLYDMILAYLKCRVEIYQRWKDEVQEMEDQPQQGSLSALAHLTTQLSLYASLWLLKYDLRAGHCCNILWTHLCKDSHLVGQCFSTFAASVSSKLRELFEVCTPLSSQNLELTKVYFQCHSDVFQHVSIFKS